MSDVLDVQATAQDVPTPSQPAPPPVPAPPAQQATPVLPKTKIKEPFVLSFTDPYSTFKDGKPVPIPCVFEGLLTQGGFSILAAAPKLGKSSISRYEAVCVAKGNPFLGRDTTQGEVVLISLEDPINHVDICLKALGYDPATDAQIRIVTKLVPSVNESIDAIGTALALMPNARLVIIDTLAKLLRCDDLYDYSKAMKEVEKVHDLARRFPQLHIQGLAHCKKAKTDNPFDALLGSTALRGETDTTLAMFEEGTQRIIAAEVRQGRGIPPTILTAQLVESAGANVVQAFSLGQPLADWQTQTTAKKEKKRKESCEEAVIRVLSEFDNKSALRTVVLVKMERNNQDSIDAINRLVGDGVVTVTGKERDSTNPLTLHLDAKSLHMHDYLNRYGGTIQ